MSAVEYITSISVNTAAASVVLGADNTIPQHYTDLIVVGYVKLSDSGHATLQFNADGGSNYSSTVLNGAGSSPSATRYSNVSALRVGAAGGASYQALTYTPYTWHIFSYSQSNTYKTVLIDMYQGHQAYNSQYELSKSVGLWRSTNPITQITAIAETSRTFSPGTSFTVWGVR